MIAITATKKSFPILLGSILLLTIGNRIYEIVLPMTLYELTHSSVTMSTMRTAELLPNFFFAIFIGVIVDRVDPRRWAVWMVGGQAVLLFLLAFLFKSSEQHMLSYYVIGFLLMTLNYGFFNAQVSLTKRIVPAGGLTAANAKISSIETLVSVMGPAFLGLFLLISNYSDGYLMTASIYLICLFLLYQLPTGDTTVPKQSDRKWTRVLREGWIAFKSNRLLFVMTMFTMFFNCSMTVVQLTIVLLAEDAMGMSASMLAVSLSASGVGGLIASLLVSKFRTRLGLGKVFGGAVMLCAAAYGILSFTSSIILFIVALGLMGFALTMYSIMIYTFRHEQTPAHLIGRIAGITGTFFRMGMPIAMYASGWVISFWGTSVVFIAAAVWNAVFFILFSRTAAWRIR